MLVSQTYVAAELWLLVVEGIHSPRATEAVVVNCLAGENFAVFLERKPPRAVPVR